MNAGSGEQRGLKTNLSENTITVQFRKCPWATIYLQRSKRRSLSLHPSLYSCCATDEAYVHFSTDVMFTNLAVEHIIEVSAEQTVGP